MHSCGVFFVVVVVFLNTLSFLPKRKGVFVAAGVWTPTHLVFDEMKVMIIDNLTLLLVSLLFLKMLQVAISVCVRVRAYLTS